MNSVGMCVFTRSHLQISRSSENDKASPRHAIFFLLFFLISFKCLELVRFLNTFLLIVCYEEVYTFIQKGYIKLCIVKTFIMFKIILK